MLFISICKGEHNIIWEKLGRWFEQKIARAIPNWQWYWNTDDEALYEKMTEGWRKYIPLDQHHQTRSSQQTFLFSLTVGNPNMQLMERTTVIQVINGWKSTGTAKSIGECQDQVGGDREQSYKDALKEKVENLGREKWAARKMFMTDEIGGHYF